MSISPTITFKAGQCHLDTSSKPYKVTPDQTPGYLYLYPEDECMHFCWRPRAKPITEPDLDLLMFPTDGSFEPYIYTTTEQPTSKTNGRIFCLKFSSSSARHLFWLQSKPQSPDGDASWLSPRDLKMGQLVHQLLQGDEVNIESEMAQVGSGSRDTEDVTMEDPEGPGDPKDPGRSGGGAGPDATGGDIREEGESSREGGADGGRASGSLDTAAVVQNFLQSLQGSGGVHQPSQGRVYTSLAELLPTTMTVPMVESATFEQVNHLLRFLPPMVLLIAQEGAASIDGMVEPNEETADAALQALSLEQKKAILKRVVRSPQFHQSLGSLTMALRDGGLPSIAEALGVKLKNGGLVKGGSVPLGGGDAVEAFVEGVKMLVEKK